MTFTDEELEGCPNEIFEDWLKTKEASIAMLAENAGYAASITEANRRKPILQLLFDAYHQKKCPYA